MSALFKPAVKAQLKGRVALCGPTGSGKTWTALEWAEVFAGDTGRIAFVDTEHGSAALYADRFTFDTLDWEPPYDPTRLVDIVKAAVTDGYSVVVVDSLTHFWSGEGGTLDIVDGAAQRAHGNSFAGWKVGTPAQRGMVDTFLGLDAHVIVTMRSKMEYIIEEDARGKKVPRKVGLAPEQRGGIEYEFTIVGDLDLEHRIVISKSRCDELADAVVQPGKAKDAARTFLTWLDVGEPAATAAERQSIIDALRPLDAEARARTVAVLREQFGPLDGMRASAVPLALALIGDVAAPVDTNDNDRGPGGGAAPPAAPTSAGGTDGGAESAPGAVAGEVPAPSSEPVDTTEKVDADGAVVIARRCADAGIGDDLREAFLWAFSDGGYRSSHDVPVDVLGELFATLTAIKKGELVLVTDPTGESGPQLVLPRDVPAARDAAASPAPPGSVFWRELVGRTPGIGEARLLRSARDMCVARDLVDDEGLPLARSLDTIPAELTDELRAWLDERAQAAS